MAGPLEFGADVKHQYYTDSRDVWKWTVLVRLAQQYNLDTILQIAMLTPDDGTSHGMQRDDPSDADATVMAFFATERQAIGGNASLKRIERVTCLGNLFQPPLNIKVISDPFDDGNRQEYFNDVCNRIRAEVRPIVAFVDPDIGIATEAMKKPSENHVTEQNLNQVWSTLVAGSPLVVYQQRRSVWLDDVQKRLGRAVMLSPQTVHDSPAVWLLHALK